MSDSTDEAALRHRRLARSALVPMASSLVTKALYFGFALLYLRVLEPAGVGVFSFVVVLTTYLDTLINFGLNTIVARDVSRELSLAPSAFRSVALIRLGLWLLGLPIVVVLVGPMRDVLRLPTEATLAGALFYAALLPSVFASTATGLLWAQERLHLPGLVSVLTTLLKVALGAAALLAGFGIVGLGLTSVAVNLVSAVVMIGCVRPALSAPRGQNVPLRSLVRESWPLFLNQFLAGLFFKVDSLLLQPIAGPVQAGIYAAAYKVIDGTLVIPSNLTLALFPLLSRRAKGGAEGLTTAYRLSLRLLMQVALPLAAGLALLAEPIVALLGGRRYLPDSAIALAILVWFMPFSFANGLTQYVLIALGRQRLLTPVFAVAVALNVAANALLIPRWGYVGAAVVTVLSEVVLLVPFAAMAQRAIPGVSVVREARLPLLATALMAPVVWWARDAVHPLVAALIAVALYPAALWWLGGIADDQRAALAPLLPAVVLRAARHIGR